MIFACVFAGRLADKYGTRRALWCATVILFVIPVPALSVLHAVPTFPMLLVVHFVLCIAVSGYAGIIPSALARIFPAHVRSTGTSFSYNIAAIFFAGMTPTIMTWAMQYSFLSTGLYVTLAAGIAMVTMPVFMKRVEMQEAASRDERQHLES